LSLQYLLAILLFARSTRRHQSFVALFQHRPLSPTSKMICLTCSGEIRPSPSEKPPEPFTTSCCHRAICSPCLSSRPSLRSYCVFCQRPADVLSSSSRAIELDEPPQFVIDSDEDEDLPAYDSIPAPSVDVVSDKKSEKQADSQIHCWSARLCHPAADRSCMQMFSLQRR
jgi:hypothetical protein